MNKLFEQKNIGNWWGAFRNLGSYVSFYLMLINFFILLINTYILGNVITSKLPIPIWLVITLAVVAILILLLVAMLFEHKYTIPSFMTYWNQQWWNHGNPLPNEIKEMRQELRELKILIKEQYQPKWHEVVNK